MQFGRPAVRAVPDHPHESDCAAVVRPLPTVPMHHRKAIAKDVDAGELPAVENIATAHAFEKGEPLQHDDARRQRKRVPHEGACVLERWISEDGRRGLGRGRRRQEINAALGIRDAVVFKVRGNDPIAGSVQELG